MRIRLCRVLLGVFVLGCGAVGVLPGMALGDASIAPEAQFSTATALPDGRVYEQVSPTDKHGGAAGIDVPSAIAAASTGVSPFASPDGNAVMFPTSAPMGEMTGYAEHALVAQRSSMGWQTRAAAPSPTETVNQSNNQIVTPWPSEDLSHLAFAGNNISYMVEDPSEGKSGVYLAGSDPLVEPVWLGRPLLSAAFLGYSNDLPAEVVGASSDLSVVYFSSSGRLTAQDAPRAPYQSEENLGLFEWSSSRGLASAGVLPNGSVSPYGALPAGRPGYGSRKNDPELFNNQVSADGSRLFFVSPDMEYCEHNGGCGGEVPELYVRETASDGTKSTVLVSRDTLLPEVGGLPASAPDGVMLTSGAPCSAREGPGQCATGGSGTRNVTYAYASSDGSHVFFGSADRLTSAAPSDAFSKEYVFDTVTGVLTYLPGVTDGIGGTAVAVAGASDGSNVVFAKRDAPSPAEVSNGEVGGRLAELDR